MECVRNPVKLIYGQGCKGCTQPDVYGHVASTGLIRGPRLGQKGFVAFSQGFARGSICRSCR